MILRKGKRVFNNAGCIRIFLVLLPVFIYFSNSHLATLIMAAFISITIYYVLMHSIFPAVFVCVGWPSSLEYMEMSHVCLTTTIIKIAY